MVIDVHDEGTPTEEHPMTTWNAIETRHLPVSGSARPMVAGKPAEQVNRHGRPSGRWRG
jgi:hypothetical protein